MGNKIKMRVCPVCGKQYTDFPATSRRDKTAICPDCGAREAMENSGLSADDQREILDMIHKFSGEYKSEMEEREEEEDGK